MLSETIEYFPKTIQEKIKYISKYEVENIEEIRLRVDQNISIKIGQEMKNLDYKISKKEIEETFENICEKSIYSYTKQISEGFITIKGGNRVGLTGSCVIEERKVKNINNISSLNFRISRQIKDVAVPILKDVIDIKNNTIFNTMIVSPPGCGKTTYLRDLIRLLSDGTGSISGKNVSVVDERSEIGNRTRMGEGFYLGKRTDLLDHCPKAEGMLMLLRTMTPEILAADEIGGKEDMKALAYVRNCGCKLLMTIHGSSLQDLFFRPVVGKYLKQFPFERYIYLEKGKKAERRIRIYAKQGEELLWQNY